MHIAIVSLGAFGHINPTLSLTTELVNAGHRVTYFTTEAFREVVEPTGAKFVPMKSWMADHDKHNETKEEKNDGQEENVAAVVPFLFLNEAGAYIEDILRVLREDRPDAILHDFAGIAGTMAADILGIPNVVVLAVLLAVAAHIVLTKTTYGRKVYAIGGNAETAGFAGINVAKITASVYVISGVMAALSGIMTAARMGSGQPSVGDGTEMTVITAVIIGGTSLNGGAGTMLGTVLGALLMNVLSSGMNLVGVSAYWQKFVMGLIIIVAVGLDQYQRSKRRS